MYSIEGATKYAELTEFERWVIQDPTPDPDPVNSTPWWEAVVLAEAWEGLGDELAQAARAAWANSMSELAEALGARATRAYVESDRLEGVISECGRAFTDLSEEQKYAVYLKRASRRPLRVPQPFPVTNA